MTELLSRVLSWEMPNSGETIFVPGRVTDLPWKGERLREGPRSTANPVPTISSVILSSSLLPPVSWFSFL